MLSKVQNKDKVNVNRDQHIMPQIVNLYVQSKVCVNAVFEVIFYRLDHVSPPHFYSTAPYTGTPEVALVLYLSTKKLTLTLPDS